jgi:hypothetical protein
MQLFIRSLNLPRSQAQCRSRLPLRLLVLTPALAALLLSASLRASAQGGGDRDAFLPNPVRSVSTVPANGDVNPYGVAFVPKHFEPASATPLREGDVLVSNFNNSSNLQGTGTTIVRIPRKGKASTFFQGAKGVGLSTALNVLKSGYVLVGNFPSTDGTCATTNAGSILVISPAGQLIRSIANKVAINGPWDSTVFDQGSHVKLFVANGLTGTVSRINLIVGWNGPYVESATQIASGYTHVCDPVTFVDAPTGLVYSPDEDRLYVASTADNKVYAIRDAAGTTHDQGMGNVVYVDNQHLHGPLGMAMAPNGHLLVSNNDVINPDPAQTSEIVEFTRQGAFVKELSVDPSAGGSFGLDVMRVNEDEISLAAVDDNASSLLIYTVPKED